MRRTNAIGICTWMTSVDEQIGYVYSSLTLHLFRKLIPFGVQSECQYFASAINCIYLTFSHGNSFRFWTWDDSFNEMIMASQTSPTLRKNLFANFRSAYTDVSALRSGLFLMNKNFATTGLWSHKAVSTLFKATKRQMFVASFAILRQWVHFLGSEQQHVRRATDFITQRSISVRGALTYHD